MQQRQLGAGGPMVSAIGLGCLSFGGMFGATDSEASLGAMDRAWDQGINFFDTANVYGMGISESVIGEWLRSRGHRPVLATKAAFVNGPPRRVDNSAAHLRAELEGSLRRLGVDHVDLFYAHRRDPACPPEELAETMAGFVREGLIGGYGLSEVSPGTLRRAHAVHAVRAVQNEYSLWTRQPELGLIGACAELGVAFVPFSPLARGALGREAFDVTTLADGDFRRSIPRFQGQDWVLNQERLTGFRSFAAARGVSVPALALAWVLAQGDHLIPIPGTRTAEHVADWRGADALQLTAHDLTQIEQLLPRGWAHGDRYSDDQARTVERYC
jgi:aryl-alcohol dehydrogenase-like predicted oxidoreductase